MAAIANVRESISILALPSLQPQITDGSAADASFQSIVCCLECLIVPHVRMSFCCRH